MKRKRFIKLCMALGLTRNEANAVATLVREEGSCFSGFNPNTVRPRGNTKSEVTRWG